MPIKEVTLLQAICDRCGFDDFHGDYSCVTDPYDDVTNSDGVVLERDETVVILCGDCVSPDEMEEDNLGYYGDEDEYNLAWTQFRERIAERNARRVKHNESSTHYRNFTPEPPIEIPEPLGWAHWVAKREQEDV